MKRKFRSLVLLLLAFVSVVVSAQSVEKVFVVANRFSKFNRLLPVGTPILQRDSSIMYINTKIYGATSTIRTALLDAGLVKVNADATTLDGYGSEHYQDTSTIVLSTFYEPTGTEETGTIYWDSDNHTYSAQLENDVTLQLGLENYVYAKNTSDSTIYNGQAASVTSAGGSFTTIARTNATSATSAYAFIGIATEDIPKNGFGFVTTHGVVRDINTNHYTEGQALYVDQDRPGFLTHDYPSAPNYVINVGIVEYKHTSNGRINVVRGISPRLADLSDVNGTPFTANGQLLVWNEDSSYFDQSGVVSYTTIDSTNAVRFHGNATVWDDLMFPFTTGNTGTLSYPTFSSDSMYYTWVVDTTGQTKCEMYWIVQMPHDWKAGDSIYPHVHYKHETGIGTPKFIIKYKWVNITGNMATTPWGWYRMESTTGTTDKTHQMAYNTKGLPGTGKGISSLILIQLHLRDNPTNVKAYQLDIHYSRDAIGSNTPTSKD